LRRNAVDCGEDSPALACETIVQSAGKQSREETVKEPATPPGTTPASQGSADRLDSWKDIAAYLKRDASTVQRWEKREGMPVHRHLHDKIGSVFAFRSELDVWSRSRNLRHEDDPGATPPVGLDIGARTGSDPAASASRPTRRTSRSPFVWLAVGAGAVLAVGVAVWLLVSAGDSWRDPLADAQFRLVTDFEGTEQAAAISRDGKFIAFLSDRDGPVDVWVTQVGTGQFHNLTHGSIRELTNPSVRTISFSPDGALVSFWVRERDASKVDRIGVWTVPTMGGPVRPYLKDVAELDWSPDGARLVYHTPGPGDPLFIRDRDKSGGRQIFEAPAGLHGHFPVWSPDESFIYVVQGKVPDEMDIWRIRPAGGIPERVTAHHSQVSHPVFLDRRTLMYLATTADGSRTGLHAVDVERRTSHAISAGVEHYTSLAASADGRRLVATVARPRGTLWRVPISEGVAEESAASRIALPTASGLSPRLGANYLLYVSSGGGRTGIWKQAAGTATELWSSPDARIVGGPAIAPDSRGIAFVVEERGRTRLYVMDDNGTNVRAVTESLEVRGSPAWAPDGVSITVAVNHDGAPRLVTVSLDGSTVPLVSEYSIDPMWSPDGRFVVYSGPDVGTTFPVKAATAGGKPHRMPDLILPRGARHLGFLPDRRGLVVLRGEIERKNFWLIDLETGTERQLTSFGREFIIKDFDVSDDGREIVFDRLKENSDIVVIDRP
jgi:Tol biopolymer transport system component